MTKLPYAFFLAFLNDEAGSVSVSKLANTIGRQWDDVIKDVNNLKAQLPGYLGLTEKECEFMIELDVNRYILSDLFIKDKASLRQ